MKMKKIDLPKKIAVFPLSNFIIFPKTTVPLNIFEPRYIEMVNDSMKTNKLIGMIQPKLKNLDSQEFKIIKENKPNKSYRECEIDFDDYLHDLDDEKEDIKFSDLELIFKDLKTLFEKKGFIINWKSLENQNLHETINALAMASPFSLEEKQVLLEAENLDSRKAKIAEILSTYVHDQFNNTTIQ